MGINTNRQTQAQVVRDHIHSLLNDLPPESLNVVEQFVQFLYEQARQGRSKSDGEEVPLYLYPSVGVPASSLGGLMGLLTEGYKGDALADTEALYDEA